MAKFVVVLVPPWRIHAPPVIMMGALLLVSVVTAMIGLWRVLTVTSLIPEVNYSSGRWGERSPSVVWMVLPLLYDNLSIRQHVVHGVRHSSYIPGLLINGRWTVDSSHRLNSATGQTKHGQCDHYRMKNDLVHFFSFHKKNKVLTLYNTILKAQALSVLLVLQIRAGLENSQDSGPCISGQRFPR